MSVAGIDHLILEDIAARPDEQAAALRVLARMDALDVAAVLGVAG